MKRFLGCRSFGWDVDRENVSVSVEQSVVGAGSRSIDRSIEGCHSWACSSWWWDIRTIGYKPCVRIDTTTTNHAGHPIISTDRSNDQAIDPPQQTTTCLNVPWPCAWSTQSAAVAVR